MYWDERWERCSRDELEAFQLQRLKETVKWLSERVPFYQKRLEGQGLVIEDISSLEDVTKLPFTVKDDLRENYPFGLCAVPMREVVRIHASSGTTGRPITGLYSAEDLELWAQCMARGLWSAGVRPDDILHDAHGYGLFTGGLGFLQGATKIGCAVVPASSGQTERQVMLLRDFGATVLCCTPSYALTIAERAEQMGVDMKELPLRIGVFGAEPWTVAMRNEIERRMGIKAHEIYGLTELSGPGIAFSCEAQDGLHINEDHFLAEVVDPDTLRPLPPGEWGELVLTSLRRQAMPLLRFRTKDLTKLRPEPCPCGRTFIRMEKVTGRSDDMLIISGVNVFPSQIESLLLEVEGIEPQYVLVVRKKGYLDQLIIKVEGKEEVFKAGPEGVEEVSNRVVHHIKEIVGITPVVELCPPMTLTRSEGKAKRVVDERPK